MTIDETKNEGLRGRVVSELASERGESPLDVLCKVALEDDHDTRVSQPVANDDEEAVAMSKRIIADVAQLEEDKRSEAS